MTLSIDLVAKENNILRWVRFTLTHSLPLLPALTDKCSQVQGERSWIEKRVGR